MSRGIFQSTSGEDLSRFGLFVFLFCFVPLFIGCFLGEYSLTLEENHRRQRAAEALEEDLSSILRQNDPKNFVQGKFARFCRQLFGRPVTPKRITKLHAAAEKKWEFAFDLYVFNNEGSLVTPTSLNLRSRFVLQKVWDNLVCTPRFRADDQVRYKKAMSLLLGSDFYLPYLSAREGKLVILRAKGEDGYIFWRKDESSRFAGTILVAWKIPDHEKILATFTRRRPYRQISLIGCRGRNSCRSFWETIPGIAQMPIPGLFAEIGRKWVFEKGILWFQTTFGDLNLFAARTQQGLELGDQKKRLRVMVLLFGIFLVGFWFRWLILKRDLYISIRLKLVLLFLFSLIVPLMGVSFLSYRMLLDREEVLVQEQIKAAKEALETVDREFLADIDNHIKLFRDLRNDPDIKGNPDRMLARAVKLIAEEKLIRYEVRDVAGNILLTTEDQKAFTGLVNVFEAMAKTCTERYLPERWAQLKEKPKKTFDMVTRMVMESPEMGFAHVMDRPDQVHTLHFGTNHMIWYWDVFADPGSPQAFITFTQNYQFAIAWYLKSRLTRRFGPFRLFAWWSDFDTWYPKGFQPNDAMENLMDRSRISLQPVSSRLTWEGQPCYAVCLPGINLKMHGLMALFSEAEITRQIASLRRSIFWGMLIALLVALITGVALAENFLGPIQELSKGMGALAERRTSHRVPIRDLDELGDLSHFFNKMMEDLKEIHMARIVQEALLPGKLPELPGYRIDMINISASDLGGDYYDVLRMKDGRLLLVIGDVTGHGVSSALLMAMAKVVVFEFAEAGQGEIIRLMQSLNELIFRILKRKKLMTFFAAMLEPETGRLIYSNAGHPFSFLRSANGTCRMLTMIRKPLGFSVTGKGSAFITQEEFLGPGDFLFVYTDGLVESQDPQGNSYSYDRLDLKLRETRETMAKDINHEVLLDVYRFRGSEENLDDDLTFGVLRRNGPNDER